MNTFRMIRRLALAALALTSSVVSLSAAQAQTVADETSPAGLRTRISPVASATKLKVCYENDGYGPVRILIRNERGTLVYDEYEISRKYAALYDLTALPSGLYSIELRTRTVRQTKQLRIAAPVRNRIVLFDTEETKPAVQPPDQPTATPKPLVQGH